MVNPRHYPRERVAGVHFFSARRILEFAVSLIGARGFEPPTSRSRTVHSSQTELCPVHTEVILVALLSLSTPTARRTLAHDQSPASCRALRSFHPSLDGSVLALFTCSGSLTVKVAPLPTRLSTRMRPWCCSMICRHTLRPRPVPPWPLVVGLLGRVEGLEDRAAAVPAGCRHRVSLTSTSPSACAGCRAPPDADGRRAAWPGGR